MLKAYGKQFLFFQKLLDLLVIYLCWWLAYWVRFYTVFSPGEVGLELSFFRYSFLVLAVNYFFLRREGLYSSNRLKPRWLEAFSILKANCAAFVALILVIYFVKDTKLSRGALSIFFLLSTLMLISIRSAIRSFLLSIRARGRNLRHVILFGSGKQADDYIEVIKAYPELGIKIMGWVDSAGMSLKYNIPDLVAPPQEIVQRYAPDAVVLAYGTKDSHWVEKFIVEFNKTTVDVKVLPDWSYSLVGHEVLDLAGIPVLLMNSPRFSKWDAFLKRAFDVLISSLLLILLLPLFILIAVAIKLTSRGPIFYAQERMGFDGREFLMWKFRSMRVDAEQEGQAQWTQKNDPRRTGLGAFLRSYSLDELPQLWNVFKGEMSLVGPRPERRVFVEQFKDRIPSYMLRHKMRAGVTGWAQVNGWRGDTSIERRIECDIYYIKNWSLWLDVKILFLTLWKIPSQAEGAGHLWS